MFRLFKNTSLLLFLVLTFGHGQTQTEWAPPDYIKSVQFQTNTSTVVLPVVQLGKIMTLSFDDLNADEADYYYRIKYYNSDWSPTTLFQNEYMDGFDNLRIANYTTSFNTLQKYTHYRLQIPNQAVQLKVSGNYMIEIYSADEELVFSRKFCLYEPSATVQAAVYRPQNMERFNTHQSLHFSITPKNLFFTNPNENIKVVLLQNEQWDTAISNIKPQYFSGTTLDYRYEAPTQFEGGNEYLFFDTKDLRVTTPNIQFTNRANLFETYLKTDPVRGLSDYTYAPDINGNFEIRNIMRPGDSHTQADYSLVHFSLAYPYELNQDEAIYIYGAFNQFQLNELNQMVYNPSLEIYEGVLLLKQGFYNYKYVFKQGDRVDKNLLSGTHAQTENNYLILVYYRAIGALNDALVGVGKINSFELQN